MSARRTANLIRYDLQNKLPVSRINSIVYMYILINVKRISDNRVDTLLL